MATEFRVVPEPAELRKQAATRGNAPELYAKCKLTLQGRSCNRTDLLTTCRHSAHHQCTSMFQVRQNANHLIIAYLRMSRAQKTLSLCLSCQSQTPMPSRNCLRLSSEPVTLRTVLGLLAQPRKLLIGKFLVNPIAVGEQKQTTHLSDWVPSRCSRTASDTCSAVGKLLKRRVRTPSRGLSMSLSLEYHRLATEGLVVDYRYWLGPCGLWSALFRASLNPKP